MNIWNKFANVDLTVFFLNIYRYRTLCTVFIFCPKQKIVTALQMSLMLVCDHIKFTLHVLGKTGNFILLRKCLKSVYYLSGGQIVWTLVCKIILRNWFVWLLNIFCCNMCHKVAYLVPWTKIRMNVRNFKVSVSFYAWMLLKSNGTFCWS